MFGGEVIHVLWVFGGCPVHTLHKISLELVYSFISTFK